MVLAAILAFVALLRSPITSVLWHLAVPLTYARNAASVSISNAFAAFSSSQALSKELRDVKAQLLAANSKLIDRDLLYSENLELKERLGRESEDFPSVLATVVMRPPGVPYDTLILDVGVQDGVGIGDLVSPGGSAYIGYIAQVYARASRVVLFSSPEQSYNALLLSASGTSTLPRRTAVSVGGQGGGSLRAEVPAGIHANVGDIVIFPSLRPEIIAKVEHVEERDDASFKTIYMRLPVNIQNLLFVEVRPRIVDIEEISNEE